MFGLWNHSVNGLRYARYLDRMDSIPLFAILIPSLPICFFRRSVVRVRSTTACVTAYFLLSPFFFIHISDCCIVSCEIRKRFAHSSLNSRWKIRKSLQSFTRSYSRQISHVAFHQSYASWLMIKVRLVQFSDRLIPDFPIGSPRRFPRTRCVMSRKMLLDEWKNHDSKYIKTYSLNKKYIYNIFSFIIIFNCFSCLDRTIL